MSQDIENIMQTEVGYDTQIAEFMNSNFAHIRSSVDDEILKRVVNKFNTATVEWVVQDTQEWTHPSPYRILQHQRTVWGTGLFYPEASQIYVAGGRDFSRYARLLLSNLRDTVAESLVKDDPRLSVTPYTNEYGPRIIDDPRDPRHEGYILTDKQGDAYGIKVSWVQ